MEQRRVKHMTGRTLCMSALIVALAIALVAGAAVARPAHKINCKGEYPCVGTPRADTMLGTNSHDKINAKGGNDYVYAARRLLRDHDRRSRRRSPARAGGRGLAPRRARQRRCLWRQGRRLHQRRWRYATTSPETMDNDDINANDGQRDVVACGSGRDRVKADPRDRLYNCEDVVRR